MELVKTTDINKVPCRDHRFQQQQVLVQTCDLVIIAEIQQNVLNTQADVNICQTNGIL